MARVEWESTIEYASSSDEFRARLADDLSTDVIFVFDSGIRMAARRVERKISTTKKRILGLGEHCVYPICRTTSLEEPAEYAPCRDSIVQSTHRLVRRLGSSVRLSYNKIESGLGVRYTAEYEIEYPTGSSYDDVLRCETELILAVERNPCAAVANG